MSKKALHMAFLCTIALIDLGNSGSVCQNMSYNDYLKECKEKNPTMEQEYCIKKARNQLQTIKDLDNCLKSCPFCPPENDGCQRALGDCRGLCYKRFDTYFRP